MLQTTNSILMIRPINFRMNEQTAVNNYYQKVLDNILPSSVNTKAQREFDAYVEKLKSFGVQVVVISDEENTDTPDSIFPNNWISFHENGTVGLYPMFAIRPPTIMEDTGTVLIFIRARSLHWKRIPGMSSGIIRPCITTSGISMCLPSPLYLTLLQKAVWSMA